MRKYGSMLWSPSKYLFYVEQYYHVPLSEVTVLKIGSYNFNVYRIWKLPSNIIYLVYFYLLEPNLKKHFALGQPVFRSKVFNDCNQGWKRMCKSIYLEALPNHFAIYQYFTASAFYLMKFLGPIGKTLEPAKQVEGVAQNLQLG